MSTRSKKVAVIGATGRLGREVVRKLHSKGIPVKCLIRSTETGTPPDFLSSLSNVEFVKGDVTDAKSVKSLLAEDEDEDGGCTACLALYGATRRSKWSDLWRDDAEVEADPGHPKLVNYGGVKNIIEAAQESQTCKRIVRITGKGESPGSFFSVLINMFGSMAKGWNYEGETLLRKSSIDYTIIRPGVMKEELSSVVDDDNNNNDNNNNKANKSNNNNKDESGGGGDSAANHQRKVLALKDNGQDLQVSAVSYGQIADLCIECLDYPNAARSTLTAMNVPPGGEGEESYAPLLAKVSPDSRVFPSSLIEEHKRAVRNTLGILMAVFASMVAGTLSLFSKWVVRRN